MRTITAVLAVLLPIALSAAQPGHIVFSELMWMGTSSSTADEWIELVNRGDETVDLAGWTITRATADSEAIMMRIGAATLAPAETFLIANYAADDERSMLAATPDLVDPAVSLPNTKLALRLYSGDPEAGADLVDWADDGSGAPLAGDADLKHSMVRVQLDGDGASAASWADAVTGSGWDVGAAELGTPGLLSSASSDLPGTGSGTAVRAATWGLARMQALGN
jgi:hypothetical protein